jgi:adenylosuccinate lyase
MIPRYSRPEMASLWTDRNRLERMLEVEIAAAQAMVGEGLVPAKALAVIKKKAKINAARIHEIETRVKHDVIAFLTQLEETIGPEARYLHLGLTSSDVLDTSLSLQMRQAADLLIRDVQTLRKTTAALALRHKGTLTAGRTHGVHAEPTTFGLKAASWYAELGRDEIRLKEVRAVINRGKLSGAVGTFAHNKPSLEVRVCRTLGLEPETVATQVIPRDRHADFLCALAIVGGTLERIAVEIRHLQRTEVLEAEEPFTEGQKGSSAMPHKRNPIGCENICGLARLLRSNAQAALENMALWHERDISHSSVERVILPDSTILLDFALHRMNGILGGLRVYPERMRQNLAKTEEFTASEKILLTLVKKGMARQKAYEMIQKHALHAWTNGVSFRSLVESDPELSKKLTARELEKCFDLSDHFRHVDEIFKRAGIR